MAERIALINWRCQVNCIEEECRWRKLARPSFFDARQLSQETAFIDACDQVKAKLRWQLGLCEPMPVLLVLRVERAGPSGDIEYLRLSHDLVGASPACVRIIPQLELAR
jgi:hypothetical protein